MAHWSAMRTLSTDATTLATADRRATVATLVSVVLIS
jgi:hypothetical protein